MQESMLKNIPNIIIPEENEELMQPIEEEEIFKVLEQMNLEKAPSLDGFPTHFFLLSWHIVKRDLKRMIKFVQKFARMGGSTNSSFLALIPPAFAPSHYAMSHTILSPKLMLIELSLYYRS